MPAARAQRRARARLVVCAVATLVFLAPQSEVLASAQPQSAQAHVGTVSLNGTSLYLNGKRWQFTGTNAPEAATDYAVNGGCGAGVNLLPFFDSLPANSVVRVDFDQDETTLVAPGLNRLVVHRDWQGLDRVVQAADRSTTHIRLIPYLGTEGGVCDGGTFKTDQWYKSGYMYPDPEPTGYARTSYWAYLQQAVQRYAGNPAVLMWEPMNEPEAADCAPGYSGPDCYSHKSCPSDATATLVNWFDRVGAEIHALDPGALVETGELSNAQCGWSGDGELLIDEAAGVDVASFHDYGDAKAPMPAGLALAIADANKADKPLVVGEVGIPADSASPTSLALRAKELEAKLHAALAAGVAGWLPWP